MSEMRNILFCLVKKYTILFRIKTREKLPTGPLYFYCLFESQTISHVIVLPLCLHSPQFRSWKLTVEGI